MQRIGDGAAPEKFTVEHLEGLGFTASNDRAIPGLLRDLEFLTGSGAPTQRNHDYRDPSKSHAVMGEGFLEKYSNLLHIDENISERDRPAIEGRFPQRP